MSIHYRDRTCKGTWSENIVGMTHSMASLKLVWCPRFDLWAMTQCADPHRRAVAPPPGCCLYGTNHGCDRHLGAIHRRQHCWRRLRRRESARHIWPRLHLSRPEHDRLFCGQGNKHHSRPSTLGACYLFPNRRRIWFLTLIFHDRNISRRSRPFGGRYGCFRALAKAPTSILRLACCLAYRFRARTFKAICASKASWNRPEMRKVTATRG